MRYFESEASPVQLAVVRTLFAVVFSCVCPLVLLAQSQSQLLPRRTCRECVIVREYNPVKDKARLWLKMLPVAELPDGRIYFSLSREMGQGPAGSNPTNFCAAGITVIAKDTPFETGANELLLLADGQPISLGLAPLGGTLSKGEKKIFNYLSVTDWETVSKLGAAQKLELHFGGKVIQFDDEQRAAVRDFLAHAKNEN